LRSRPLNTRVFDGHNDVLLRLHLGQEDPVAAFVEGRPDGHLDLPRAERAGFAGGMFAVFVPGAADDEPPEPRLDRPLDPPIGFDDARAVSERMAELLRRLEEGSAGRLRVIRTAAELESCVAGEAVGAVLHFEGAEPIDDGLRNLEAWYERGLRSLGLVWSRPNAFAEGVPFRFPSSPDTGPGLTPAGRELVRECNRLGILLDLSHLNERGFWDVARLSEAPLVASHSNAHALHPASRNLTDDQLDAIAASDGLVGATFHARFLSDGSATVADFVHHVDYLVERMGIEHVGFGSDFDGCPLPEDMEDVTALPRVPDALRAAGYDESALRRLGHENWVRVIAATW
jgi:membrane dipeptidase